MRERRTGRVLAAVATILVGRAGAWMHAHPPGHLHRADGYGPSYGSGPKAEGIDYQAPAATAWSQDDLEVGVQAAAHGRVVIQAASAVTWLDPLPYPDDQPGRRIRLLAAGSCPASIHGYIGVRAGSAGLGEALVPAGSPTRALVCGYSGLNGKATTPHLAFRHVLDAGDAAVLSAALHTIPVSHEVGGATSCPSGDVSRITLVALAYRHRPDVDLWQDSTTCPRIANGSIYASVWLVPKAASRLMSRVSKQ